METSEKGERVLALIAAKSDCDAEEIKLESKWSELGIDSLDLFELVMEFENAFGITIPDEDVYKLETIGDAIAYIEKH